MSPLDLNYPLNFKKSSYRQYDLPRLALNSFQIANRVLQILYRPLHVSFSGLNSAVKSKLKAICEDAGISIDTTIVKHQTRALIMTELVVSEKLIKALVHQVPIVSPEWMIDLYQSGSMPSSSIPCKYSYSL